MGHTHMTFPLMQVEVYLQLVTVDIINILHTSYQLKHQKANGCSPVLETCTEAHCLSLLTSPPAPWTFA